MSKSFMEKLDEIEIDGGKLFFSSLKWVLIIGTIWFLSYMILTVYNPKKRAYINGSKMAYAKIEEAANEYFKDHGALFKENEENNVFCNLLVDKYAKSGGTCLNAKSKHPKENFVFKGSKVTVYGLEKPTFDVWGTPSKDIIIDINGDKGENQLGIDRSIVRIHSTGRMGGLLAPVSCNIDDHRDYDITYSPVCPSGIKHSFLTQNIPYGFDVYQIGGKKGKSRKIASNIAFFRADCIAFGGEIVSSDGLCERRGYHWLEACYDEYPCEIELSK